MLFKNIGTHGGVYLALSETIVSVSDDGTASILDESGATLGSNLSARSGQHARGPGLGVDDRLQKNIYWIWQKFSHFCQGQLPEGSSYIVQKALRFEILCSEGSDRFDCRYLGGELVGVPGSDGWFRTLYDNDRAGDGLTGHPKDLDHKGDAILVRLQNSGTTHSEVNPDRRFCWRTQFCHIKLIERFNWGVRRYRATYFPPSPNPS